MSDRFEERDEVKSFIIEKTRPGLEAAFEVAMENLPRYFTDVAMIRTALHDLKEMTTPCTCGDPACLSAPQHRALYSDQLEAALEELEKVTDQVIEAVTEMAWSTYSCRCIGCVMEDRQNAAPWN